MAFVSIPDFARMAGVSAPAVWKAIREHRVIEGSDGLVDTEETVNILYLEHRPDQRLAAQFKRARAERREREKDGDLHDEFQKILDLEPGFDRSDKMATFFFNRLKNFPDGWCHLDLADVLEPDGRKSPLLFFSPDGEEGLYGIPTQLFMDEYKIDMKTATATDRAGATHRLALTTHGAVPWVTKAVRARSAVKPKKPREAAKSKPSVGVSAVSKHEGGATARGVTDSAGKGGGRSKSYRKVGLNVSGSKTERTGRRIPPERN